MRVLPQDPPQMRLPEQSLPIQRNLLMSQASLSNAGVETAQTSCDYLPGLAQQLCYATLYGIET
jgi:hypothetical protein